MRRLIQHLWEPEKENVVRDAYLTADATVQGT